MSIPDAPSGSLVESPLSRLAGDMQKRPTRALALPGERFAEANVVLWCLTDQETRVAQLEAAKYLRDVAKVSEALAAADASISEAEFKTQVLYRALRDGKDPSRGFAGSPNELRIYLTPDEREAMFSAYLDFVDDRSCTRKVRTAEELDGIVASLAEPRAAEAALSFWDGPSLRRLVVEMVGRLRDLQLAAAAAAASAQAQA